MSNLTDFQQNVLRPLREERDRLFTATYKKEAEAKTAYNSEIEQIAIDKKEFLKKQSQELKMFNISLKERRTKAYADVLQVLCEIKTERRAINENHNDALCRAFADYNHQRKENDEPLFTFDDALRVVKEEREEIAKVDGE